MPGQVRPPSGLWSSSKAGAAHRWCAAPVYVENAPRRGGVPSCPVVARAVPGAQFTPHSGFTCDIAGERSHERVRVRATHHVRDSFAQNADHFAHDSLLSAFFAEVVCTLGATPSRTATSPPRTATSPPPNGRNCAVRGARSSSAHVEGAAKRGNCTIRGATRRRHAEARLLMVQNPPSLPLASCSPTAAGLPGQALAQCAGPSPPVQGHPGA